jgi:hypothetical protein
MCLIGSPEANDSSKRMDAHSMVEGASKSLAAECARLCSEEARASGVKSNMKSVKRESSSKLKFRHYHLQDPELVKFRELKMKMEGLPKKRKEQRNGLLAHYNMRVERDLGVGVAALRRIPCSCDDCMTQLSLKNVTERYASSVTCKYWSLFEGLNDWKLVKLVADGTADLIAEEICRAKSTVLHGIATSVAERIEDGLFGAFLTDDPDSDGYYVVQWTSDPYTLQESIELEEYDPPLHLEAGELVCEARYLNKVPRARQWYTAPTTDLPTTVRLQQVIDPMLELLEISPANKLPNNCDKRACERLQARKISNESHEELIEEIHRRECLDFDEEHGQEEEESSDDDESEQESERSDSSSSDNEEVQQ